MSSLDQRLDLELVTRGLAKSRARAQELISERRVTVGGAIVTKPTRKVSPDSLITVATPEMEWVGRGAKKLLAALFHFQLDPTGKVAADIGASTGGFTQVLLQFGASKVFAVDVGQGQLVSEIAKDIRVVNLEKTNARDLTRNIVPDPLNMIVADVSFISLKKVLPAVLQLCTPGAALVALVKPQFEVGKGNVGKGGIVRDAALVNQVAIDMENWINEQSGWSSLGVIDSPITGSDGNREFLLGARLDD
ncbi:MAG: TlyA family RNA methyltransferase [Proteobacteria bacterium]|nr:TlyA family RNA methyltransferase [Pseudomonadota bacterium]